MRVLVIFPPQCRPFHPPLGPALLKSELERRGHVCKNVDLNLRFYEHLLQPKTLEAATCSLSRQVAKLDSAGTLSGPEAVRFARMGAGLFRSRYLIRHVTEALNVFRSPDFYQYGRFLWGRKVLEESIDLYASAYGYTDIGLSRLCMRYGTGTPSDVWQATRDQVENPFIDLLVGWAMEEIESCKPDVVGLSIMLDEQLIPAVTLARQLRERWGGKLVAGGSMVTRLRNVLPTVEPFASLFDRYFAYEAEVDFADFVDNLEGVKSTAAGDYSELCPDFDDYPLDRYLLPERVLPYQGSRGCSYGRCRYCSHHKTYDRYKFGNPTAMARHLKELFNKYNCRHYYLVDEALEPKFGTKLAKALEEINLDVRWMVFARLHRGWNEQVVKAIAGAGCRRLIFGLDSASDRVQKLMDKNTDLPHAEKILQWCSEYGVAVQLNSIVGYPGEVENEALEALTFLKRNQRSLAVIGTTYAFSNFVLVPEAAWSEMGVLPIMEKGKEFALSYSYIVPNGLTMKEGVPLAQRLQAEADRALESSRRFPLLREFAFLYRDFFGATGKPDRIFEAPAPGLEVHWLRNDLKALSEQIELAKKHLPAVPNEYFSEWWRVANENGIAIQISGDMHAYVAGSRFSENSFELPILEVWKVPQADHAMVS